MATIILIFAIIAAVKSVRKSNTKQLQYSQAVRTIPAVNNADYKQNQKEQHERHKAAEKAARDREKAIAAAEKKRIAQQQAEADREFIIHQLDIYSEFLRQADQQLKIINWEIWKDDQQQEYDSADARRKKLEPLQKKIISYETKIHSLESKLAKVEYILQD